LRCFVVIVIYVTAVHF